MSARVSTTAWARWQANQGFTQGATWKHVFKAERFQRIHEDDVQIAVDPPMLEGIVEQNHLTAKFVDRDGCRGDSIGILEMRYVGQPSFQLERFVIASSRFRSVSTADEGDTNAQLSEASCDPGNHRCLTRTA
jgi:hypothetical protein